MSSQTISLEDEAKRTLAFLSEFEENNQEWDCDRDSYNKHARKEQLRILLPIKNLRAPKTERARINTSQLSHRGRATLIPSKVSLENQQGSRQKNRQKTIIQGSSFTKENFRPHKTIRNTYNLTKQAHER